MSYPARIIGMLSFAIALAPSIWGTVAHAADNIRYISITGNNAAPCTLAAPCRTLQRGINTTPVGGELRILDSGSFGTNATVNRSMTITGNGNTVLLNTPLTINAEGAVVALRGLTLDGQGAATDGISVPVAATVHIEDCVVHGFTDDGIVVAGADARALIVDSTLRDNGDVGLLVGNTSTVRISRSTVTRNARGIVPIGTVETSQDNIIRDNTANISEGTLTPFNLL